MRRLILLSLLATLASPYSNNLAAQEAAAGRFVIEGSTPLPYTPGEGNFSWWRGEALLVAENRLYAPLIRVFDREAKEISRFWLTIPEAGRIMVLNNAIARGPDGILAVVGRAFSTDSRGVGFLAIVSPDGQEQTIVKLYPFSPDTVTVAADGTIWVAGNTFIDGKPQRNEDLIRRYDRSGKLIGSSVNWSSLGHPTRWPATLSALVSSPDRVGWYSKYAQTYIEFSLDGREMLRLKTAHDASEVLHAALCDDGGVFVSAIVNNHPSQNIKARWGIYVLDRERGEWDYIPRPGPWGRVYGCDRTRLATTTDHRNITWLKPAQ